MFSFHITYTLIKCNAYYLSFSFFLGKLGLFYLIFYGMLAALVAICMWVFFQTLDPRIPKWQLDRSIIGTNPGMGFRPMPLDNLESTLIWFQGSNRSSYEKWENNTKAYLDSTLGYFRDFENKVFCSSNYVKMFVLRQSKYFSIRKISFQSCYLSISKTIKCFFLYFQFKAEFLKFKH